MAYIALPSKFMPGWNGQHNEPTKVGHKFDDLSEMLNTHWRSDAHAVMYDHDGAFRLNKSSLVWYHANGEPLPKMTSIFIDVDTPGHEPIEEAPTEWWTQIKQCMATVPELQHAGIYYTRHGLRFVWPLAEPIDVEHGEHYLAQFIDYLNSAGLGADPLSDWTRVMRLPFVIRESRMERREANFDRMAPLRWEAPIELRPQGSPSAMGTPYRTDMPIADSLKKRSMGSLAPYRDKWYYTTLREEMPVAGEGARHKTFVQIAADICQTARTNDPMIPFQLLLPNWQSSFGEHRGTTELWNVCLWAASLYDGADKEITEREQDVFRRMSEVFDLPIERVESRLVLVSTTGSEYYVFSEETMDYHAPITDRVQLLARLTQNNPSLIRRMYTEKGQPHADRVLLERFSAPVETVRADYMAQRSHYEPKTSTLTFPTARIDPNLKPEFDERIDRWLRALGGNRAEEFLDWLATFLRLDRATCGLYIHGDDGVGKGMLADGIARIWNTAPVPYSNLLTNFQEDLSRVPFIVADESVPQDMFSTSDSSIFRRMIGNGNQRYDRKYKSTVTVHGYPRILITANNPDALKIREALTPQDIEAIQQRIGYIQIGSEPKQLLKELAGDQPIREMTEGWVAGGGIARQIMWLAENREVEVDDRWLVRGWESSLTRNMLVTFGIAPAVIRFLALTMLDGHTFEGIYYGDGQVEVNVDATRKFWQRVMGTTSSPPDVQELTNTLQILSTGKVRRRIGNAKNAVHIWQLDPDLIAGGSEVHSIADAAEIRAVIDSPTPGNKLIAGGKSAKPGQEGLA